MYLTRRDTLRVSLAVGQLWLLSACAMDRSEIASYSDPSLSQERVKSIAFLPFRNAHLLPPEAREIDQAIGSAVLRVNPHLERVISSAEAERSLWSSGVVKEWEKLTEAKNLNDHRAADGLQIIGEATWGGRIINAPDSYSVPDGDALQMIGSALHVDAFMQGDLVGVAQRGGRADLLDLGLPGHSRTGATGVILRYTLYATDDARTLWSTSAEGLAFTATSLEPAPDVMVAINLALAEIYTKIPQL